jgi:hypothetical protein
MRATTGGSPARSLRSASTTLAHSMAITHVAIACSGVAPPPITDSPATTSARSPGTRAISASARWRIWSALWRSMASAGTSSQRSSSKLRSVFSSTW